MSNDFLHAHKWGKSPPSLAAFTNILYSGVIL